MKVNYVFKILVVSGFFVLTACSSSDEKKEEVQTSMVNDSKLDTIDSKELKSEKKEIKKEEKESVKKEFTLNGTYKNSENSILIISNWSSSSFNFEYKLKGNCSGINESGLAVYEDKHNALHYGEEGNDLEHFSINDNGTIELDFGISMLDYVGMECAKFFDGHFVKK